MNLKRTGGNRRRRAYRRVPLLLKVTLIPSIPLSILLVEILCDEDAGVPYRSTGLKIEFSSINHTGISIYLLHSRISYNSIPCRAFAVATKFVCCGLNVHE